MGRGAPALRPGRPGDPSAGSGGSPWRRTPARRTFRRPRSAVAAGVAPLCLPQAKYPCLLGQAPLEVLDFVVDPKRQKLITNPEHGGIQMTEEY